MKKPFPLILLLFFGVLNLMAQTTVWTGSVNDDWNNASNWTSGIPVSGSVATVPTTPNTLNRFPTVYSAINVNFTIQNAGRITFNGNVNNTGSIVNFANSTFINNGDFTNTGNVTFDNDGIFTNNRCFINLGTLDNAGTASFTSTAGSCFINEASGSFINNGTFTNGGTFFNRGLVTLNNTFVNSGYFQNEKTFIAQNGSTFTNNSNGNLSVKPNSSFSTNGVFNSAGYVQNDGSFTVLSGGVYTQTGSPFVNNTTISNSGRWNNNATLVLNQTNSIFNNEAGGIFTNTGFIDNKGTFEVLVCSTLIQNSPSYLGGNVWVIGIVYIVGPAGVNSNVMGGVVLNNLNQKPTPTAVCKNATITLPLSGSVTLDPALVDNGSSATYCTITNRSVSVPTLNCTHVGTRPVVLTVTDNFGTSASCTSQVTVFPSSACGGPVCQNVTAPGEIRGTQSGCAPLDPNMLTSASFPTGGVGALQYVWLSTTVDPAINNNNPPANLVTVINNNSATYDPGPITVTTWFRRCARRDGCTDYVGESNWIKVTITGSCANCSNVTISGTIGVDQSGCSPFDPAIINNITFPEGGTGTLEYTWISITTDPSAFGQYPPMNLVTEIPNNSASFNPGPITQTTWFRRCARRNGCTVYTGESNWVKMTVTGPCAPVCTATITGFQFKNPSNANSPVTNIVNGGTYSIESLTNPFNFEALVSGTVESVRFTLSGSASGTNIENFSSWDYIGTGSAWPHGGGTFKMVVQAYQLDNAQGALCATREVNFTLTACSNITHPGAITGGQTGCPGYNPTVLNSTSLPSGGTGTIEYVWLSTTTSPANYTNGNVPANLVTVINSNTPTFDPGPLQVTTWFRRCSRRAGCVNYVGESNWVQITISNSGCVSCVNVTSPGSIGSPQSGCPGFDPALLTSVSLPSGGSGNLEYVWLSTTTNPGNYTNGNVPSNLVTVIRTNTATLDPSPIQVTTWFRRCARRAGCIDYIGESNWVQISVQDANPVARTRNITVTLGSNCQYALTAAEVNNGSTGGCGTITNLSVTPNVFTTATLGNRTVTLTVTTSQGKTSTATATVTVVAPASCTTTPCPTSSNRTVSNTANCNNNPAYSAYLITGYPNSSPYYTITNGTFVENSDGTARFTGVLTNVTRTTLRWTVDVTFTGRTFIAPSGSPKIEGCYTANTNGWYYYTTTNGVLTGSGDANGARINVTRNGPAFQIGNGAQSYDNNSANFGGSGWLNQSVVNHPSNGVRLSVGAGDFNFRLSGSALTNCPVAGNPCIGAPGKLLREYFANISGWSVSNLTSHPSYPNNPTSSSQLVNFQGPSHIADNYGTRVRGYIVPDVTGPYSFRITGDDNTIFRLSTTPLAANATTVASVEGWTNEGELYKYSGQASPTINLVKGQYYYVELLHKEGNGGDHFAVYWKKPNSSNFVVVPSACLASYACPAGSVNTRSGDLSENEETINRDFSLFPNPANDYFEVDLTGFSGVDVTISLFDQVGRQVQVKNIGEGMNNRIEWNTGDLSSGWYIVQVRSGETVLNKKLVIAK
jgi:hypothetical protein